MTVCCCPFCGERAPREFEFHKTAPPPSASPFARVYERTEQADLSCEHWQHVGGCRGWLLVRRNPSTDAVIDIAWLGGSV